MNVQIELGDGLSVVPNQGSGSGRSTWKIMKGDI